MIIIMFITLLNSFSYHTVQASDTPRSATSSPVPVYLNPTDTQIINKVRNQVQEYLQYSRLTTLDTLGNYLKKDVLNTINFLHTSFQNEVQKSQKRDTAQNMTSKPYKSLAYCMLFFNTLIDTLQPLITKYEKLKTDRTTKKYQAASQKTVAPVLTQAQEYFSLKSNIMLPYQNFKQIVDQAITSSLVKLLEYTNW